VPALSHQILVTPLFIGKFVLILVKPSAHCRRKVRLSQKTARQRRQSHFCATVWTWLKVSGAAAQWSWFCSRAHVSGVAWVIGARIGLRIILPPQKVMMCLCPLIIPILPPPPDCRPGRFAASPHLLRHWQVPVFNKSEIENVRRRMLWSRDRPTRWWWESRVTWLWWGM